MIPLSPSGQPLLLMVPPLTTAPDANLAHVKTPVGRLLDLIMLYTPSRDFDKQVKRTPNRPAVGELQEGYML